MPTDRKRTILVTGFGPFSVHRVNASWEAVKHLEKLCADSDAFKDFRLILQEIPVSYEYVSKHVPRLWQEHRPTIVMHVGVSRKAECLTIEHRAHSTGYTQLDIHKKSPNESDVPTSVLQTDCDIDRTCDLVNENSTETGCRACVSKDAGRYLCEYTFYHSLSIEPRRTLFVHVPDLDVYPTERTARGLHDILRYTIERLDEP